MELDCSRANLVHRKENRGNVSDDPPGSVGQQTRFQLISIDPSDCPVVDFRAETSEQKQTWIIALRKSLEVEIKVTGITELEKS